MKRLISYLVIVAIILLAMIIAPQLVGEKGYVLIALGRWTIEMSVVSLGILVFVALVAWIILGGVAKRSIRALAKSGAWFGSRSERRRQRAFYQGIQALAQGDLLAANKALELTREGDFDGVNYLAAAEVARGLKEPARAESLLKEAMTYPNSELPAALLLARQYLADDNPKQALNILGEVNEKHRTASQWIAVKAEAMAADGQWQALAEQLPFWRKGLGKRYFRWAQLIAKGQFAEIASKRGANALQEHWESLGRKQRTDPAYRAAYVEQLLEQGDHQAVEKVLVTWQKNGPDDDLLQYYKRLRLPNPTNAMRQIEKWLKANDKNAALYSTLGHIAFHAGDMILAEKALVKAVHLQPDPADYEMLAKLCETRHDSEKALAYYRQSQLLLT